MKETFNVEAVLRDVLDVLCKHNIPIETASLNVSLLDAAFDEHIPQLTTYKAGVFHRPLVIDDVPLLFRAERRYPFDEVVQVIEQELRPPIEAFTEALKQEFPDLKIRFVSKNTTSSPDDRSSLVLNSYSLGLECQFSDDVHADYNQLNLMVFLHQREATDYPHLNSWVGWLVDEESGGEWGVDIKYQSNYRQLNYAPHLTNLLKRTLPDHFKTFREEIARKQSGEIANFS